MTRPQRGSGPQPQAGTSQAAGQTAQKHPNSGRSLRNQIRGVERLLKRTDLSSEAREVQEAKLAELQAKAQEKAHGNLERKMTLRYRRVRPTRRGGVTNALAVRTLLKVSLPA